MSQWLYISPHLDDVVLSCGATIYQQVKQGDSVTVLTVFTECGSSKVKDKYLRRKADDRAAGKLLGFQGIHLGLLDAPFRSETYNSFYSIMFAKPTDRASIHLIGQLVGKLKNKIQEIKPDYVMFPLGVGGHIDHKIVYAASKELGLAAEVGYYEERPYAFMPAAAITRWYECTQVPETTLTKHLGKYQIEWEKLKLPFLQNYMIDDKDKIMSCQALNNAYSRLDIRDMEKNEWIDGGTRWKREMLPVSDAAADLLFQAVDCYSTETGALFNCAETMPPSERLNQIKSVYCLAINKLPFYEGMWIRG